MAKSYLVGIGLLDGRVVVVLYAEPDDETRSARSPSEHLVWQAVTQL